MSAEKLKQAFGHITFAEHGLFAAHYKDHDVNDELNAAKRLIMEVAEAYEVEKKQSAMFHQYYDDCKSERDRIKEWWREAIKECDQLKVEFRLEHTLTETLKARVAEVDQLKEQLSLFEKKQLPDYMIEVENENAKLKAQVESLTRDKEMLDWLVKFVDDNGAIGFDRFWMRSGENNDLRQAITAAMRKESNE